MQAMLDREQHYVLEGLIQVDDAYLGGERSGGKAGRGSENKVPFVAAISMSDEGHAQRNGRPVAGFSLKAIAQWANSSLAPGARYCATDWPASARSSPSRAISPRLPEGVPSRWSCLSSIG